MNEVVFKPEPFKPVDKIPPEKHFSKIDFILTRFIESPYKIVLVDDYFFTNAYTFACSLRRTIRNRGYKGIKVVLRKSKVYLVKG